MSDQNVPLNPEDVNYVPTHEEDIQASIEEAKKLAETLGPLGNGRCSEPGCECSGFVPRALHPWQCKRRGCRHGADQHF